MADINTHPEPEQLPPIPPSLPSIQHPTLSIPADPTPIKPASSFPLPFNLPDLSKFTSIPLTPPPKSSPLYARLDRILARIDQLPAFSAVKLPNEYISIISKKRIEFDTRVSDWKRGALLDTFFDQIVLPNFEDQVDLIEQCFSPQGWSIFWDEATESHYFECLETGVVSWSWPEIPPLPAEPISGPPLPQGEPLKILKIDDQEMKNVSTAEQTPASVEVLVGGEQIDASNKAPLTDAIVKKKIITRPETVSISAKSKKMASMLKNWHTAKSELREFELAQDNMEKGEEEEAFEKLQKWADHQSGVDVNNPNFTPLVPRKRARSDEK
ncbi:hypothetical protein BDR26DRAFT_122313 [Obelidium mucronatum]|nr:hypothetical protein BDR26DRAFT_122313 [Obelidium mucronatum]